MAWTSFRSIFFKNPITITMVVAGVINCISNKWASRVYFSNTEYNKDTYLYFALSQILIASFGKMLCLIIYQYTISCTNIGINHPLALGNKNFNLMALLPAVLCEQFSVLIAYVGLSQLGISNFQISRNGLVFFVLLIYIYLVRQEIAERERPAIVIVIVSMAAVGAFGIFYECDWTNHEDIILGNIVLIIAQVMVALQIVYEEQYLIDLDTSPLQTVGWEGMLGLAIMTLTLSVIYWIYPHPAAAILDGILEIGSNPLQLTAMLISAFSMSFYAFSAACVTKETSAITRIVLENIGTPIVWILCLFMGWQEFHWAYLLIITLLMSGTYIYIEFYYFTNEQSCSENNVEDVLCTLNNPIVQGQRCLGRAMTP